MADGPCAEEAPSELASLNRVPKERHKCNNNDNELATNIENESSAVAVRKSDSNSCFVVSVDVDFRVDVDVDVDIDIDVNVNGDENGEIKIKSVDDDDHEDEDNDDDRDNDDEDEDEDDDGDDEDEVSRSSVISGCVSDEVLLRSSPSPAIVDETLVVVLHPVTVRKKTLNAVKNAAEEDRTTKIKSGVVITEPKQGPGPGAGAGAGATFEKEPVGVANNFKGQIRNAQDTLVGPCGKKRCVDRYDSSESSDSGVAVSCGECSSSGTSDITEPGSPCSTSSDEGLAGIRSAAPSPPHNKLAPPTPPPSRGPQWPWTPPLAATACSTLKKTKGEPEAGTLPKAGAADPTTCRVKSHHQHQHQHQHQQHDGAASGPTPPSTQGKITEYFKTQIKPQQIKVKKSLDMSMLVAKGSPEFRRPPTVQRNKGGLAKYLGTVPPNGRPNDWEVRTLTMSPPPIKNLPVVVPRVHNKIEKLQSPLPSLPISTNILNSLPAVKLSSLRLPSDVSPEAKTVAPATPTPSLTEKPAEADFGDNVFVKPAVNENNNLTSAFITTRSIENDHLSRLSPATPTLPDLGITRVDDKPNVPLSPILTAPTTIRFPAQAPGKNRPQTTDSGICRWDQCDARFDSSSGLLEHLQVSHINTQTGGDNFICHWQGCKVQGRTSCSRRWLERHVLSHGGNKPFRCIVDGCGSRFSSQITLERHVNGHFNQPETSSSSSRKSCENGGKLVRRNGKRLRYRRQPWSARLFDFIDTGVMEGLQHRLLELSRTRTQGRLAETPGDAMALTSQVLARRVEHDGKTKVLLRWYPQDIAPDEWVLESEVQETKHIRICNAAATSPDQVNLALYPAMSGGSPPQTRIKQRRKPIKNS